MRKSTASLLSFACRLVASWMVAGASPVSFAAPVPQWFSDAERHELREFDEFLSNHPWIANKLWENPHVQTTKSFWRTIRSFATDYRTIPTRGKSSVKTLGPSWTGCVISSATARTAVTVAGTGITTPLAASLPDSIASSMVIPR